MVANWPVLQHVRFANAILKGFLLVVQLLNVLPFHLIIQLLGGLMGLAGINMRHGLMGWWQQAVVSAGNLFLLWKLVFDVPAHLQGFVPAGA
ncbi:MAG TPA: hypothetical protein PKD90_15150 [Phnomibacter sp.]|nr:hypothetical protein [Phnomibacter sp.]